MSSRASLSQLTLPTAPTASGQAATKSYVDESLRTVSSLASITSPVTGQLALLTTDLMIYRWTGSAWLGIMHTAVDGGHARYRRTTGQANAFVTGEWTRQAYNVAVDTDADVSPNVAFDRFTMNRTGLWEIDASSRSGATTVDLARYHLGIFPGATPGTGTYKVCPTVIEQFATTNATNLGVSLRRRFTAGADICVASWRSGGDNASSDASDEGFCSLDMRWVGP